MNSKITSLAVACCSLLALNVYGQTVPQPTAQVTVDGVAYDIPIRTTDENKTRYTFDGVTIGSEQQGFTIRFLEGNLIDPDPMIAYGVAVTDFGAPSIFGFLFGTPIVPTGPGTVVSASVAGSLTDGGSDNVTITPTGASLQTSSVGMPLTSMGLGIGGAESGIAGGSDVYGPYSLGPVAGPGGGPWSSLEVGVGFGLSGGGDIATLSGRASIETGTVPETLPTWVTLAALGLVLVAGHRQVRPVA